MKIPYDVLTILQKLKQHGFEGYAVGGCVRDSLLDKEPNDWDITTNATPEQMMQCFEGLRIIETGLKHGTLTVLLGGVGYEVTTYRIDGEYTDHRRPDSVQFVSDLRLDLERRDFTVNAMAMDSMGTITDLFDGRGDLEKKVIRCVGEPEKRFTEDALRILRAFRFASVYDFSIDESTAKAAYELKDTLAKVSAERIFVELKKLLCGKGVQRILTAYPWIMETIFPELRPLHVLKTAAGSDIWSDTVKAMVLAPKDPIYRLALLFHGVGKPFAHYRAAIGAECFLGFPIFSAETAETCLLRMKSDNQTVKKVVLLIKEQELYKTADKKGIIEALLRLGRKDFTDLFPLWEALLPVSGDSHLLVKQKDVREEAVRILESGLCLSPKELAIGGNDLKNLGISGLAVGRILNSLVRKVALCGVENSKENLLALAQEIYEKESPSC